ncbi:MAG: hypothetical protein ABSF69_27380, partial [Polyangiaceae bacterium]
MLSILLLGFVLGMRHATDPDHVVAVTTIVVRERRLWTSSLVGVLWGLGHTATLLFVGGAIVLFEVVIPARVGLALEFTVAIMLVVLGLMNLSNRFADSAITNAPKTRYVSAPSSVALRRPTHFGLTTRPLEFLGGAFERLRIRVFRTSLSASALCARLGLSHRIVSGAVAPHRP